MNFCTKCASYYAKPGTCNCYARAGVGGNDATPWAHPTNPEPYHFCEPDPDSTAATCKHCGKPLPYAPNVTITYVADSGHHGGTLRTTYRALKELHAMGFASYTDHPVGV